MSSPSSSSRGREEEATSSLSSTSSRRSSVDLGIHDDESSVVAERNAHDNESSVVAIVDERNAYATERHPPPRAAGATRTDRQGRETIRRSEFASFSGEDQSSSFRQRGYQEVNNNPADAEGKTEIGASARSEGNNDSVHGFTEASTFYSGDRSSVEEKEQALEGTLRVRRAVEEGHGGRGVGRPPPHSGAQGDVSLGIPYGSLLLSAAVLQQQQQQDRLLRLGVDTSALASVAATAAALAGRAPVPLAFYSTRPDQFFHDTLGTAIPGAHSTGTLQRELGSGNRTAGIEGSSVLHQYLLERHHPHSLVGLVDAAVPSPLHREDLERSSRQILDLQLRGERAASGVGSSSPSGGESSLASSLPGRGASSPEEGALSSSHSSTSVLAELFRSSTAGLTSPHPIWGSVGSNMPVPQATGAAQNRSTSNYGLLAPAAMSVGARTLPQADHSLPLHHSPALSLMPPALPRTEDYNSSLMGHNLLPRDITAPQLQASSRYGRFFNREYSNDSSRILGGLNEDEALLFTYPRDVLDLGTLPLPYAPGGLTLRGLAGADGRNLPPIHNSPRVALTRNDPMISQAGSARDPASIGASSRSFPLRQLQVLPSEPRHLPPCEEGQIQAYPQRERFPLSGDEDENWLSEYLCYVRSDLVEVFRASETFRATRGNSTRVSPLQVGVRCPFCAHLPDKKRAPRSCSFPSSTSRIYRSVYMMIHDHFPKCQAMPESARIKFQKVKDAARQGAAKSIDYWEDSALKLGMVDTRHGILMARDVNENDLLVHREEIQANYFPRGQSARAPPAGYMGNVPSAASRLTWPADSDPPDADMSQPLLVTDDDQSVAPEYLFALLSQARRIILTTSERAGRRRSLEAGSPGFGCRYCLDNNRSGGNCRFFPNRKRILPDKLEDLYDHLQRCALCPQEVKSRLESLQDHVKASPSEVSRDRDFLDQVWTRIQGAGVGRRDPGKRQKR